MKLKISVLLLSSFIATQIFAQPGKSAQKLATFMNIVEQTYVDTVNENMLVEEAINSMLTELDPHSVYISKKDLQKMNEPLEGKFDGVGIQFNILKDTILVVSPISGGPSEKLGIRAGDKIIKIDNELVAGVGYKNNDVMKSLRGVKGTKVNVAIYRRGEKELLDFEITRDKIPIYSVDAAYMMDDQTGYIKVNRFAAQTVQEFRTGLDSLKNQGLENLILDLRGNSGGYLNTAIDLADQFLEDGKLIVYTEGRTSPKQETFATRKGDFEKGKLIVLIDEGSASASEIVSGAVQDWDRGLVIGRRSFGKGLVQKPFGLPDGSAVRLTISRYYTPSGRCIQKPYEDGNKKDYYQGDMEARLEHGEFYFADSIKLDENLKYQTSNGRTVYGGGGILPDIFIPLDTTGSSKYFSKLLRKGVFYEYTLNLMDTKREQFLNDYKNVKIFKEQFIVSNDLMEDLFAFADKKEIERNQEDIEISKTRMETLLKAQIARTLYGTSAFYEIMNPTDNTIQAALEAIEDNTFKKMKLTYK